MQRDVGGVESLGVSLARTAGTGTYKTQTLVMTSLGRNLLADPSPVDFTAAYGQVIEEGSTIEIINAALEQDGLTFKDASAADRLGPENQVLLLEGYRVLYASRTFTLYQFNEAGTTALTVGMPGEYTPTVSAEQTGTTTVTVTTAAAHYLLPGDRVIIVGIGDNTAGAGITELNTNVYTVVTTPLATTYTITVPTAAAVGTCNAVASGAYTYVLRWSTPAIFGARVAAAMDAAAAATANRYEVSFNDITQAFRIKRVAGTLAFGFTFPTSGGVGTMLGFNIGYTYMYQLPSLRTDQPLINQSLTPNQVYADERAMQFYSDTTPYTDFFRGMPTQETMQTLGGDMEEFGNSAFLPPGVTYPFFFVDGVGATVSFNVTPGYYSYDGLARYIQIGMQAATTDAGETITVTYNGTTGAYTFTTNRPEITLLFDTTNTSSTALLVSTYLRFYPKNFSNQSISSDYARERRDQEQRYSYTSDTVTDLLTIQRTASAQGVVNTVGGIVAVGDVVTITTVAAHGLDVGDIIYFTGESTVTGWPSLLEVGPPSRSGYHYVYSAPTATTFTIRIESYAAGADPNLRTGFHKITQPFMFYTNSLLFPESAMRRLGYNVPYYGATLYTGQQAPLNGGNLFYVDLDIVGGRSTWGITGAVQAEGSTAYRPQVTSFSFHGLIDPGSNQTTVYGDAQVTRAGLPWRIRILAADGQPYRTYGQPIYVAFRITPAVPPGTATVQLQGYDANSSASKRRFM
jgi:hypothetical protein